MSPPSTLPSPFGRYLLLRKVGEGGMGSVYLAEDSQLGRKVAIKVPHFSASDGPDLIARFYREARLAAGIEHPNICAVYDVGQVEGVHYLTMPFIEGTPLSHRVGPDRPWPIVQAVELIRRLGVALEFMHQRGIIHRDLKPGNVMLRPNGEPVLMDFGLARSFTGHGRNLTVRGQVMGTPGYMAPEQVTGAHEALGPATDVYSLGVILYQLLTGVPPFEGPLEAVYGQILHMTPVAPSTLCAGVPPALDAVVCKALEKKPPDRYPAMAAFAAALHTYLVGAESVPGTLSGLPVPPREGKGSDSTLVICPGCKRVLRLPPNLGGRPVMCPGCRTAIRPVPSTVDSSAVYEPTSTLETFSDPLGSGPSIQPGGRPGRTTQRPSAIPPAVPVPSSAPVAVLPVSPPPVPPPGSWPHVESPSLDLRSILPPTAAPTPAPPVAFDPVAVAPDSMQPRRRGPLLFVVLAFLLLAGTAATLGWMYGLRDTRPQENGGEVGSAQPPVQASPETVQRPSEQRPREVHSEPASLPASFTNTLGMKMMLIPAGGFRMGSPSTEEGRSRDETPHEVEFRHGFYVGAREVTQEQYERLMGRNPSTFQRGKGGGPDHPVENVTWEQAVAFCRRLSAQAEERTAGRVYDLPTEAEWEYAARAGTSTPFGPGATLSASQANFDGRPPDMISWEKAAPLAGFGVQALQRFVFRERTLPAGSFPANAWGLHDMHGNVAEWCSDWYAFYDVTYRHDPTGPPHATGRKVIRGGSWLVDAAHCRSAYRSSNSPAKSADDVGFRVVVRTGGAPR